jgi:hypothetical protein
MAKSQLSEAMSFMRDNRVRTITLTFEDGSAWTFSAQDLQREQIVPYGDLDIDDRVRIVASIERLQFIGFTRSMATALRAKQGVVVTKLGPGSLQRYHVRMVGEGSLYRFDREDLEKVAPEPCAQPLKVGDRVRVTASFDMLRKRGISSVRANYLRGREATLQGIFTDAPRHDEVRYRLRFDDDSITVLPPGFVEKVVKTTI